MTDMSKSKVTFHVGHKFSRNHNTRNYDKGKWNVDGHIDENRSSDNLVIIDRALRDVFEDEFRNAMDKFNDKNKSKHPERLKDMSTYLRENRKSVYEVIYQFGSADNKPISDFEARELCQAYVDHFIEKNPSMVVFGAYVHMDETTPHLHLDFLPVKESNRGMEKQVSIDGALKEMGYKRGDKYADRPFIRWLEDSRNDAETFTKDWCQEKGLNIDVAPHEKGQSKSHLEYWQKAIEDKQKESHLIDFQKGNIALQMKMMENQQALINRMREKDDYEY